MQRDNIIYIDPKARAEEQVRLIVLSILSDVGLKTYGYELGNIIRSYGEGVDNYCVIDDFVIRNSTIEDLVETDNFSMIRSQVIKALRVSLLKSLGPVYELCAGYSC